MAPKPPLRLSRPDAGKGALNLASAEFQAFIDGGRGGAPLAPAAAPAVAIPIAPETSPPPAALDVLPAETATPVPPRDEGVAPEAAPSRAPRAPKSARPVPIAAAPVPVPRGQPRVVADFNERDEALLEAADEFEDGHAIGLRLPELVARKLDRIAEVWLCHRHKIMLDLVTPGLRALATAAERGEPLRFPPPYDRPGRKRALTLRLKADVAGDLDRILTRHGAIKSQLLMRLLVPAIEELYDREIGSQARPQPRNSQSRTSG